MPNPTPWWGWCAQPGAARSTQLAIDSNTMGDGYIHRATRGLNPARPSWTLVFPFTNLVELQAMDDFLTRNAACGFWMQPPDASAPLFVTCDTWSATIADKNIAPDGGMVGTLQATFARSFNPQPVTPT
jgi:phage-related protein